MSPLSDDVQNAGTGAFDETDWWMVRRAGQPDRTEAPQARETLCATYWKPVFRYVRRLGYSPEDAEDMTQSFFACLLEKNYVQTAAAEKGKFRSFLLVMLKRFLADQHDRAHRQKRGGGAIAISLDSADTEFRSRNEPPDPHTPDRDLERLWASSLLNCVLQRLEQQVAANARKRELLRLLPLVTGEEEENYATVAQALGWTEVNVKVCVLRLRRRLGELMRQELTRTKVTPQDIEQEIQDLLLAFS